ncbi:MAG: type II toxin-antitoxin system VapC family toxin [Actinomycetota bacterium]|nr:type II toxin-antitoxin system VapC family toxin [Actinomycetota bacterium]
MIDASVFVDALVVLGEGGDAARLELLGEPALQVPTTFLPETVSALRGLVRRGDLSPIRAVTAIQEARSLRVVEYSFEPFFRRVWELRDNLSVYDAFYVALAEALDTALVTCDDKLLQAPGPRCRRRRPREAGL